MSALPHYSVLLMFWKSGSPHIPDQQTLWNPKKALAHVKAHQIGIIVCSTQGRDVAIHKLTIPFFVLKRVTYVNVAGVTKSTKVHDILTMFRWCHLIANLHHVHYTLYYDPYSKQPFEREAVLHEIGVQALSTLHLHMCLLGEEN